jgi:hypothetical protein
MAIVFRFRNRVVLTNLAGREALDGRAVGAAPQPNVALGSFRQKAFRPPGRKAARGEEGTFSASTAAASLLERACYGSVSAETE